MADSSNTVDQRIEIVLGLCKSSQYGASGDLITTNLFVLVTNKSAPLILMEAVLEVHSIIDLMVWSWPSN
jgi:hypothetical protein